LFVEEKKEGTSQKLEYPPSPNSDEYVKLVTNEEKKEYPTRREVSKHSNCLTIKLL
jgi:hypothetical protein